MSDEDKIIAAFELFNEKAEELLSSTFLNTLLQVGNNYNLSVNWESGEEISSFVRTGPSKDEIKAFVLDLRYFIQDNEKISFRNLKKLYSNSLLAENLKRVSIRQEKR